MVKDYIDAINENMSVIHPELYKKLLKRLNKRDIAIFNLLSNGNSILFISNSSKRVKLYNNLSSFELELLVCDFENDIHDESFPEYLIEDFDSYSNMDVNVNELLNKKSNLELKISILSNHYSNLRLTPAEIKSKKDFYLNKLNGEELIFPVQYADRYDESSLKSDVDEINDIIRKYGDVFIYDEVISHDFFKTNDYKELLDISNSFMQDLTEFQTVNSKLNNLLGLKIFSDLDSAELLENISFNQNNVYVEKKDRHELDKILKQYIADSNIDLSSNDIIKKYSNENFEFFNSILDNIEYSELIDNDLFVDDKKRLNLFLLKNQIDYLIQLSKYLKKRLYSISKFYKNYPFFELDQYSFNTNIDFNDLVNSFDMFCNDLKKLGKYKEFVQYSYNDENVEFFIGLALSQKVKKNMISDTFQFNVYKKLLDNFLHEFDFTDEEKLDVKYYTNKINSINSTIGESNVSQFINMIKFYPIKFNDSETVLKQKDELVSKIANDDFDSILDIFKRYKDLIIANRRIFMISEDSLPILHDMGYIDEFDYIVKDDKILTKI